MSTLRDVPSIAQLPLIFRTDVLPSDVDTVRRLVTSSGFFSDEEVSIAAELVQEALDRGAASGYDFVFAMSEGETVGYSCYGAIPGTESSFDLYWIAISQVHRGLGLGHVLLHRTEALIEEQGGTRMYIETSSRDQYQPTRAFYLRCGYREAAFLEDFYRSGDGKVIFVKELRKKPF